MLLPTLPWTLWLPPSTAAACLLPQCSTGRLRMQVRAGRQPASCMTRCILAHSRASEHACGSSRLCAPHDLLLCLSLSAGMAAGHVGELAALGLKSLRPRQVLESLMAVGATSQLLYARIDAPRFAGINSAKGRWSLLDWLLLTPENRAILAPDLLAPAPASAHVPAGPATSSGQQQQQQPGGHSMGLGAVVEVVKRVAADILGSELEGGASWLTESEVESGAGVAIGACPGAAGCLLYASSALSSNGLKICATPPYHTCRRRQLPSRRVGQPVRRGAVQHAQHYGGTAAARHSGL